MNARNRHVGSRERLDNSIFALDLMRRREQRARRFLAHDEPRIRSLKQKRGIRLPADKLSHGQRPMKVRHPLAQLARERLFVEAMTLADCRELALQRP